MAIYFTCTEEMINCDKLHDFMCLLSRSMLIFLTKFCCFSLFAEDRLTQDCQKSPWTNIWKMLYQEMVSKQSSSSMRRWHKNRMAMKKGKFLGGYISCAEYTFFNIIDMQGNTKNVTAILCTCTDWPTCLVFASVCSLLTYACGQIYRNVQGHITQY